MQIQQNVDLAPLLWYRLGGTAKYLLTCKNREDILEALEFVGKNNITNILTIGDGSNLIFAKEFFDGAVIRITGTGREIEKKENVVECFAGETLDDLIQFGFENKLTGLQWAGGLPGTVGAGVRGNVGAFGGEIKDTFVTAEVAKIENRNVIISQFAKEDMNFSYRESKVKHEKDALVLTATFQLHQASSEELTQAKAVYEKNKNYRKERHPIEYPNCGSVFKNIVKKEEVEKVFQVLPNVREKALSDWYGKVSMGFLIDNLGFTGKRVGGAQVSEKHSNFIINTGSATGHDVLTLITEIQNAVQEKFGFTPEVEPEIIR